MRIFDQAYQDSKVFREIDERIPAELRERIRNSADTPKFNESNTWRRIMDINSHVHIGGLAHVFENYGIKNPLYQKLADRVTQRIKLCDVFNF